MGIERDRELLQRLYRESKDVREKDRYHALYALSLGFEKSVVAGLFCRDLDTINNWLKKWEEERNVRDGERGGAPPKVDEKLEKKIVKLVKENEPQKHGVNTSFWDCTELHKYFFSKGVLISNEAIRKALKRNGFRYVKAELEFAQADKKEQKRFLGRFGRFLKRMAKGESMLFLDEFAASVSPKKGYLWTREERPAVKTFSIRKKVNVVGAINPLTGSGVIAASLKLKAKDLVKFLSKVAYRFRRPVTIFLDNFNVHKSKLVRDFLATHPRIRLEPLPKYSPELNLFEQLINYCRNKFLNNRLFRNDRHLMLAFHAFFRNLSRETIKSVCNVDIILNRIT